MLIAIARGKQNAQSGCLVKYKGEEGYGIKEVLDDYALLLPELFYSGESLPEESGLYKFEGFVWVHMVSGSDEPITFHGEFDEVITSIAT